MRQASALLIVKRGLSGRHLSHLTVPSVKTVCANYLILPTDAIAMHSLIVPTADHASRLYRMFLMIVKKQQCRFFPCVQSAKRNTTIRSTDAFTPNQTPALFVVHR